MSISNSEIIPDNISLKKAYSTIRKWYKANIDMALGRDGIYRDSVTLIENLPETNVVTDLEIRVIMGEILYGCLEWAYHEYIGNYHIATYVHEALNAAGFSHPLADISEEENNQLKKSIIWPHIYMMH